MTRLFTPALAFFLTATLTVIHFPGADRKSIDDKWNGTISFIESDTGPDIISSEWKMEGNFTNSTGPIVHSSKYQYKDGVGEIKRNCLANGTGRVEVIIDEAKKQYTIMVHGVPDCGGKNIEYGVTSDFKIPGGDTAIYIPDQPLGASKNVLTGSLIYKDGPLAQGIVQSHVYKWNLSKVR